MQNIRIYLHPDETADELQTLITEQTDVSAHNQILLLKDTHLLKVVEKTTPGRGYPSTQEDGPVLLFSTENNNVTLQPESNFFINPLAFLMFSILPNALLVF